MQNNVQSLMYVGCKNSNLKLNQSAYKIGFRIIDICLKDSFSREPTINSRDDAIIDEFKPPQHDIATQIGTFKKFISGTVHIAANYLEGHLENRGTWKIRSVIIMVRFFCSRSVCSHKAESTQANLLSKMHFLRTIMKQ